MPKSRVDRTTFYLHYETIDDLLKETIEMVYSRFYSLFGTNKDAFKDNWQSIKEKEELLLVTPEYLLPYLTFIKDNKKLFKLMYDKPELFNGEKTFRKLYEEIFQPILSIFLVPKEEQEYILQFYTKGILAIIFEWLKEDCEDDINKIISIITKCISIEMVN